jgi:hypothetical protein
MKAQKEYELKLKEKKKGLDDQDKKVQEILQENIRMQVTEVINFRRKREYTRIN